MPKARAVGVGAPPGTPLTAPHTRHNTQSALSRRPPHRPAACDSVATRIGSRAAARRGAASCSSPTLASLSACIVSTSGAQLRCTTAADSAGGEGARMRSVWAAVGGVAWSLRRRTVEGRRQLVLADLQLVCVFQRLSKGDGHALKRQVSAALGTRAQQQHALLVRHNRRFHGELLQQLAERGRARHALARTGRECRARHLALALSLLSPPLSVALPRARGRCGAPLAPDFAWFSRQILLCVAASRTSRGVSPRMASPALCSFRRMRLLRV